MRRAAAVSFFLLCACVGPAPSYSSYEGKVAATAEDMGSAVETTRLAVGVTSDNRAFSEYVAMVISWA
jgi:hypothetical protein